MNVDVPLHSLIDSTQVRALQFFLKVAYLERLPLTTPTCAPLSVCRVEAAKVSRNMQELSFIISDV